MAAAGRSSCDYVGRDRAVEVGRQIYGAGSHTSRSPPTTPLLAVPLHKRTEKADGSSGPGSGQVANPAFTTPMNNRRVAIPFASFGQISEKSALAE